MGVGVGVGVGMGVGVGVGIIWVWVWVGGWVGAQGDGLISRPIVGLRVLSCAVLQIDIYDGCLRVLVSV